MKRFFENIILAAGLSVPAALVAQTPADAVRYSLDEINGTARYTSMGGAFGALGGDFSGLTVNPGGIGVYRSSEFTITPAFYSGVATGTYEGNKDAESIGNFNFGNLGFVGVKNFAHGKWKSAQFAIGINRTASYQQRYGFQGSDVPTSLLDDYAMQANAKGIPWQDLDQANYGFFDLSLAWQTYLLDTVPGGQGYWNAIGLMPVDQRYLITEEGSKRETFIGGGANYDHRLYFGGGVSFIRTNYSSTSRYNEYIDPTDTTTALNEFARHTYYEANGLGVQFKGGAIYRATDWLRLGLAAHSPTWISISDEYSTEMEAIYSGGLTLLSDLPTGTYDFSVRTPYKLTGSVAFIFGKSAIVSVDADFIDYRTMRMRGISDNNDFAAEENRIKNAFTATANIRSGIEWRFAPTWYARGGFALYGNPYKSSLNTFASQQPYILGDGVKTYSVGLGYRDDIYILDFSYQVSTHKSETFLYSASLANPAVASFTNHQVGVTVGFRF